MLFSAALVVGLMRPDLVVEQRILAALSALEINEPIKEVATIGKACVAWSFVDRGMTGHQWYPLAEGLPHKYRIFGNANYSMHLFEYLSVITGPEGNVSGADLYLPIIRSPASK